jgi:NADPH2:quinone reductase
MKAIVVKKFGGPEELRVQEIATPERAAGEVLVRVHAAGVNPVETYIRAGTYAKLPELPYTPGTDGAGVVERVGDGVKSTAPGDRAWFMGTSTGSYAEFALCDAAQAHPLPKRLTFAQGAAVGVPYLAGYRALFQRGGARPGETVLMHGATGGVGLAAVQLARAAGLTVFATGGTEQGRVATVENGAHQVFDHRALDYLNDIKQETGGRGVDIVLEMLANMNLANDLTILATHGRVVVIGSRGKIEIDPRETMGREADIRGMMAFGGSPEEMAAANAALGAGLENGTLRPVVGREFPLAKAADAHRAVMESGALGKIVLVAGE